MNAESNRRGLIAPLAIAGVLTVGIWVSSAIFFAPARLPVAIGASEDGTLLTAVCVDIDPDDIYNSQRVAGEWSDLWSAHGTTHLARGTVLVFGVAPAGMSSRETSKPSAASSEMLIQLVADDKSINALFPPHTLARGEQGTWFHTDGSSSSSPCDERS